MALHEGLQGGRDWMRRGTDGVVVVQHEGLQGCGNEVGRGTEAYIGRPLCREVGLLGDLGNIAGT
jgi:hypothetical protein